MYISFKHSNISRASRSRINDWSLVKDMSVTEETFCWHQVIVNHIHGIQPWNPKYLTERKEHDKRKSLAKQLLHFYEWIKETKCLTCPYFLFTSSTVNQGLSICKDSLEFAYRPSHLSSLVALFSCSPYVKRNVIRIEGKITAKHYAKWSSDTWCESAQQSTTRNSHLTKLF